MYKKEIIAGVVLILLLIIAIVLTPSLDHGERQEPVPTPVPTIQVPRYLEDSVRKFSSDAGGEFSVYAYDLTSQHIILDFNARKEMPAASLAKLAVAYTLYKLSDEGAIDLGTVVELQDSDKVPGTGDLQGAPAGTQYTLRQLCQLMIATSDNTAANMLEEIIGFERIRKELDDRGLKATHIDRKYFDETGPEGSKITTSAWDIGTLMTMFVTGHGLSKESADEIMLALSKTTDHTKIPATLGEGSMVWNKIGALENAELDAAIVRTPAGRVYVLVVMSNGVSTNEKAIAAIQSISREIYSFEVGLRYP